jgi:hypothetical protein
LCTGLRGSEPLLAPKRSVGARAQGVRATPMLRFRAPCKTPPPLFPLSKCSRPSSLLELLVRCGVVVLLVVLLLVVRVRLPGLVQALPGQK